MYRGLSVVMIKHQDQSKLTEERVSFGLQFQRGNCPLRWGSMEASSGHDDRSRKLRYDSFICWKEAKRMNWKWSKAMNFQSPPPNNTLLSSRLHFLYPYKEHQSIQIPESMETISHFSHHILTGRETRVKLVLKIPSENKWNQISQPSYTYIFMNISFATYSENSAKVFNESQLLPRQKKIQEHEHPLFVYIPLLFSVLILSFNSMNFEQL